MMKSVSMMQILIDIEKNSGGVSSYHFDEISEIKFKSISSANIISTSIDVLRSARDISEERSVKSLWLSVYIPTGMSSEIERWSPEKINSIKLQSEPPSLHASSLHSLFDDSAEEYQRPIIVSGQAALDFGMKCLFRSFRDAISMENEWEFSNGIYLYCHTGDGVGGSMN